MVVQTLHCGVMNVAVLTISSLKYSSLRSKPSSILIMCVIVHTVVTADLRTLITCNGLHSWSQVGLSFECSGVVPKVHKHRVNNSYCSVLSSTYPLGDLNTWAIVQRANYAAPNIPPWRTDEGVESAPPGCSTLSC